MSQAKSGRLVYYPFYTMGDFAGGLFTVTPSILLIFYMTNVLGVPAELATLAAVVPKIIDLISSPLIGTLSDRTRSRLGRRRPYILFAALTTMPTFALMWYAPFSDPVASAWFILVSFSLATLCFGCFVIPFFALNAEIATSYHDRTQLNSMRAVYAMVGCLAAGAAAPLIVGMTGGGRHGYVILGIVLGLGMSAAMLVTFFNSREPARAVDRPTPSWRQIAGALGSNRAFLFLSGAFFVTTVSAGVVTATTAYFVTYILGRGTEFLSLTFFLQFGATIVTIPLWAMLGARFGKFPLFAAALLLQAALVLAYMFLDRSTPLPLVLAPMIAIGVTVGGVQVFAFSMLGDCIHAFSGRADGLPVEAMFTGFFIAGEKLGYAVGALLAGLIFSFTGLVATTQGATTQPQSAIDGIRIAMSIIPAAVNILAAAIFYFYLPFERETVRLERLARAEGG